jgi:hypothetical protein
MAQFKHNKKRNTGLIQEFFSRYIAKALVEFREADVAKATTLWTKLLQESPELSRELGLVNGLYEGRFSDRGVALRHLSRIMEMAEKLDASKLWREKTRAIHEINKVFGPSGEFFDAKVDDFKVLASIQVLLNAWMTESVGSSGKLAVSKLEEQVLEHMQTATTPPGEESEAFGHTREDVDALVVEVFRKKFEEKYGSKLSEQQRALIGGYLFAGSHPESRSGFKLTLESIRAQTVQLIDRELSAGDPKIPRLQMQTIQRFLDTDYQVSSVRENCLIPEPTLLMYLAVSGLLDELKTPKDPKE